ncbi:MAG: tRNA 2-thiouridine(34) synthase MnmA, partial [Fidelibacterota bacterium]
MKKKVMVAMSGGVDSSVALLRVLDMGYDAFGVTMKLWDYATSGGNIRRDNSCCSVDEINGAKLVCDKMGVPHYTIDFSDIFRKTVIDDFAEEYLSGRTPNPCIRCNSFVKWEAFLQQAEILGADMIATGHYARIEFCDGVPFLKKGVDPVKDQAYVLWGIPRESLKKTLLPLGGLTKNQVRE